MEWMQLLSGERRRSYSRPASKSDHRTEFEKDYHRVIASASFRRLQDKTQVFPLDSSDFVRTRLTHSMEVSSIAKSLGQSVGHILMEKGILSAEQAGGVKDILLCAGLLHDIGNPPFGHFGETIIRQWFADNLDSLMYQGKSACMWLTEQMRQDFYKFEGNAQTLRVISRLHYLVDEYGMNLTYALMNTVIKYPVPSTEADSGKQDIKYKKMGYFYADEEVFYQVTEGTGAGGSRYPLVYLLEAADDIAYKTVDLEDGFKKGAITFYQLQNALREACENGAEDITYRGCRNASDKLESLFARAINKKETNPELYAIQNWVVYVQGLLINAATDAFMEHYGEIMAGCYTKDLFYGTPCEKLAKTLGNAAYEKVFQTRDIIKLEVAAQTIMNFLLDAFVKAAVHYDSSEAMTAGEEKLMDLVSENHKKVYHLAASGKDEGERLYLRILLATDYVSGMTDHYAKGLYQELNGIY